MVLVVKNPPDNAEVILGGEGSLEEGMAAHFGIIARRIPWTEEEPGGLQSMGSQRVGHD